VATTQLDAVISGEEFSLQGIEDDDETSDADPSPELEKMSSQQADALNAPANTNAALDLLHFFSGVEPNRGKSAKDVQRPSKICKLCSHVSTFLYLFCSLTISSEKYGTDKSMIPSNTPNFIYGPRTGNENLRRHLYNHHSEAYDKAVLNYKWKYRLSTESSHLST
jgi:hypothetical protein